MKALSNGMTYEQVVTALNSGKLSLEKAKTLVAEIGMRIVPVPAKYATKAYQYTVEFSI